MAHHTDIDCFIAACPWKHELPEDKRYKLSQEERDGFVVGHMMAAHTIIEIVAETAVRQGEVETDRTLTQEQVEDRNAILRILRRTAMTMDTPR